MTDVTGRLDEFIEQAKRYRMDTPYDEGVERVLLCESNDGEKATVVLMGVPPEAVPDVIIEIANNVLPFIPDIMVLVSDAWVDVKGWEEGVGGGVRKRPAVRWKEGDPTIQEAVTVSIITRNHTITAVIPYRWHMIDGWEWDKPSIKETDT